VTAVKVRRDWGIGTDDILVVDGGGDGDVLADWETEDVICPGEGETVARALVSAWKGWEFIGKVINSHSDIVRDRSPLDELKVLGLIGLEDCSCFCGFGKSAKLAFRRTAELKASPHSRVGKVNKSEKGKLTASPDLQSTKEQSQARGMGDIVIVDDSCTHEDQSHRNV